MFRLASFLACDGSVNSPVRFGMNSGEYSPPQNPLLEEALI
jgi:hypothetical protein